MKPRPWRRGTARQPHGFQRARSEPGQASVLVVGGLVALVLGALVLGLRRARGWAGGAGAAGGGPRRAGRGAGDARRLRAAVRARLRRPAVPGPRHLSKAAYLALGRAAAADVAEAQRRERRARSSFPDARRRSRRSGCASTVRDRFEVRTGGGATVRADRGERRGRARAAGGELGDGAAASYDGPLAERQGERDAPRRRARLRPPGARRARRRRRARRHQRLPLGRRAGGPLRPPSRPALGRAARARRCTASAPSSTSARRPRTAGWRPTRPASTSKRYAWEPWHWGYALNARSPARVRRRDGAAPTAASGSTLPGFVPAAFAPRDRARRAALERLGDAARRAALRGEQLQPVRGQPARARRGSRSSCPAPRAAIGLTRPVRRRARDRRAGAPDARPAAAVPRRPARARGLQRRPDAGRRLRVRPRHTGETPGYVARILGLMSGAGASSTGALEVRLVR